jgi:hypothetical protein
MPGADVRSESQVLFNGLAVSIESEDLGTAIAVRDPADRLRFVGGQDFQVLADGELTEGLSGPHGELGFVGHTGLIHRPSD